MGVLNPASRIIDVALTDKARTKMALGEKLKITKFALFDYGVNYNLADLTAKPADPDYPTLFTLEPVKKESVAVYENRLFTIPPGTDSRRLIQVTPDEGTVTINNPLECEVKTRVLQRATGGQIFRKRTRYVVFLKNPVDAKYVELLEIVDPDEDFLTPPDTPGFTEPDEGEDEREVQ